MNSTQEICNSFNKVASEYDSVAKVQKEIGLRLFERLDLLKIEPRFILDLGSGTGYFTAKLKRLYPKARIIAFDLAQGMLLKGKEKQTFTKKWSCVAGDMNRMPFPAGLFDLVFSNQTIHWSSSLPNLFREINRVMNINGCLMFSSLGPDTFIELKKAWLVGDSYQHAINFLDMHDLGDILLKEYFLDPVVDMEKLVLHYDSLSNLLTSLKKQGVRNINPQRNPGLTGKTAWVQFKKTYESLKIKDKYPLSYEIIYGHAWKGMQMQSEQGHEVRVSIDSIKKRSP